MLCGKKTSTKYAVRQEGVFMNSKLDRDIFYAIPAGKKATPVQQNSDEITSDETFKDKLSRLVRDSDKNAVCAGCCGTKMATVDAVDNLIEKTITTYRRISTKGTNDATN
jgi:hypothetical protein